MNRPKITVTHDFLRSPLVLPAAIVYILSALFGMVGVILLLQPGAKAIMVEDMVLAGITDRSALSTWQFINAAITVVCFLWAVLMSICLASALAGKADRGLNLVYYITHGGVWVVNALGICAAGLFIYRLAAFLIGRFNLYDWVYQVYAMLVSEALMVTLAWLVFRMIRKFLDCLCDSAASIGYTFSSGTLGYPTIPGFTATGFLLLGIVGIVVFLDRFFTLTIVKAYRHEYYAVLTAQDPLLLLSGASFFFGAVGSFLISAYLRKYKLKCELTLYRSTKR